MSRATDITLTLIILQASIGFVNASGMFAVSSLSSSDYYASNNNSQTYAISDLETIKQGETEQPSVWDYFTNVAKWTWDALVFGINIIFSVVFIWPTLVSTFGMPGDLAAFIQVGVYFTYAYWYWQFKSGKGGKLYE